MTKPDLRQLIGQTLVRWQMPTRQAAINEIVSLIDQWTAEVIGEDELMQGDYPVGHNHSWIESKVRNQLRAEQRKRTGINVQTNQREEVKSMTIYEEYAKNKLEIRILTERLKEIEPEILKEISGLSAPMKTELGTFSPVKTVTYKLSDEAMAQQSELKDKIKEIYKVDVESGNAEALETVGLRFVPAKTE